MIPEPDQKMALGTTLRQLVQDFASFTGRRGITAVVLVGLGAILEALSLAVIAPLLSLAIGSQVLPGALGRALTTSFRVFQIEGPAGRLALLLGVFALVMLGRAVVLSARDIRVAKLQTGFVEAQRLRIAEYLVAAQWDQIVQLRHTRITHLLGSEVHRIGEVTQLVARCFVSAVMLIAQLGLVLLLAPLFGSLAIVFLIVGILIFLPFIRRAHAVGELMTSANLSLLDSTTQFLGGLKLALSQNLQKGFISELRQSLQELTLRQIDYRRQQSYFRNALSVVSALAAALLVFIGFTTFHIASAILVALVVIIARMINPLGQLQQDVQQIVHSLPAYEKAKEFEREFAALPRRQRWRAPGGHLPDGPVRFEKVSYCYASATDRAVGSVRGVKDLNLTIQPGEFIGVTGPSGGGKTTFADLLVALCPPQQGRIFVAGTKLDEAVLASWHDSVSYVAQDPFLFHDTVQRNMTWAAPDVTDEEVWNALAIVEADKLVRGMPLGLDTIVGERGAVVSGGERQRVALARGILRKPRLLVLDEATSAIDVAGERRILRNILALPHRPTIVLIAHRAESLVLCDRVFQFENGQVVREVTKASILASNGS